MEGNRRAGPQVLMLPWLALGHAIPFVELAKRLCDRGFTVHLCSTKPILSAMENRMQREAYRKIHTVEIHLPPIPGLPSLYGSTSSLPPHLMPLLKNDFQACKPELTAILHNLKPDFLIHDYLPWWLPALAAELGIRDILFATFSAAVLSLYMNLMAGCTAEDLANSPLGSVKRHQFEIERMDKFLKDNTREKEQVQQSYEFVQKQAEGRRIVFVKTKRFLEERFVDYVEALTQRKVVPVGTLVAETTACPLSDKRFTDWLEKKGTSSVVFVSFGTEYFMSKDEIAEIAFGLELSEQNFIWVIRLIEEREEDDGKIESVLPVGFLERVRDRGLVVNGWAPQTTILSHPSTGGFLTHCGWGSMCEGMACGVPFVALPLKNIDQPWNAKIIVGELGLGVEIERQENGDFKREKVGEAIKRVMVKGEESEGMRRKAKETAERIIREGDAREIDEIVAEMSRMLPQPPK